MKLMSISIVISTTLFMETMVRKTNADIEVAEYSWARREGDYVPAESDSSVIGQKIEREEFDSLCIIARLQMEADVRENSNPDFGLYKIKLVTEPNTTSWNLLECPTSFAPIYLKRISPGDNDESFVLYRHSGETYLRLRNV